MQDPWQASRVLNLPRIPSPIAAYCAGATLRAYFGRLLDQAPALAKAFVRGFRGL